MSRNKKRIIWWEREAFVSGAAEARVRGSQEDGGRRRAGWPYYGPVTIPEETGPAAREGLRLITTR
ncbi:MAG: hypothetical protein ABSF84_13830 [Acidimicrobiales bacterium]